jgi:hypothetical protein
MDFMTSQQRRRFQKLYLERFYVLHVEISGPRGNINLKLSGSTRSVYTLTVMTDGRVKCDCPDFEGHCCHNGCFCKHICFLLVRVCKIALDARLLADRRLCGSDLHATRCRLELLATGHDRLEADLVDQTLTGKYESVLTQATDVLREFVAQPLEEGNVKDCSICYESLDEGERSQCPECHKQIHKDCIGRWLESHRTCPLCRSKVWERFGKTSRMGGRYLQL